MGKGSTIAIILLIIVATLMYLLVEDETEWIEETTRVAKFNQLEKSSEELYRMRSRILSTCTEQSLLSLSFSLKQTLHRQIFDYVRTTKHIRYEEQEDRIRKVDRCRISSTGGRVTE